MAGYIIATVQITDPIRYEDYKRLVPVTIEAFGGRFLVRGGQSEALEGEWKPERIVILEFPTVERAKAWWNSTEYAGAKAIRQASSQGNLLLVEGI